MDNMCIEKIYIINVCFAIGNVDWFVVGGFVVFIADRPSAIKKCSKT